MHLPAGTSTTYTPHNNILPNKGSHSTHSPTHKKKTTEVTPTHRTLPGTTNSAQRPPKDHREAMGRPDSSKWGEAERKEVKVLKDMGVAPVVDLPQGRR